MLGDDESVDPLMDPFASISNDPLNEYNGNGYHTDSSSNSSSYMNSYSPSLSITPSIAGLTVHKIPAFGSSLTITKIDDRRFETVPNNTYQKSFEKGLQYNHRSNGIVTEMPKKRGRKKGSKNKFKRGIPIETWQKCGMQFNKGSLVITKVGDNGVENFAESDLALILNGNGNKKNGIDENKVKRKYTKRIKLDEDSGYQKNYLSERVPVRASAPIADPASRLTIELDPAHYYPDEPFPKDFKVRRKRRRGGQDRAGAVLPFSCDICRKGFKCAKGVQAHKSTKHGVEDLSGCYPCECCELVFLLKRDLSQHILEHRDSRGLLPCPEPSCGEGEPDVAGLARHKATKHPYLGTLGRSWFHTWGDT